MSTIYIALLPMGACIGAGWVSNTTHYDVDVTVARKNATRSADATCTLHEDCKVDDSNIRHTMTSINLDNHKNCYILITNKQYHNFIEDLFGVQVGSEGSVPANDGKSNGRYVSCSKPSLHHHKTPLGTGAV